MGKIERIKTADMSRIDWLEERRKSIGGSEIGAILGLNRYQSPYSVWANKTGRLPDSEQNEAMRQGTDLEEYVASRFMEATGLKVERCNFLMRNSDYPHLHANIDRRIVGQKAGLECKTASALNEKRFQNGNFPSSYYAQCVSYLAVTELERWFLAVVVLGRDFKIFQMTTIEDDPAPDWCESSVYVSPEEFEAMRDAAIEFWGYVENDEAPPIDGMPSTTDAIKTIYADADPEEVADLFGLEDVLDELPKAIMEKKAAEMKVDELQNKIKDRLGTASIGTHERYEVTWKEQSRTSLDTKALQKAHPDLDLAPFQKVSKFRKFNVKEIK